MAEQFNFYQRGLLHAAIVAGSKVKSEALSTEAEVLRVMENGRALGYHAEREGMHVILSWPTREAGSA